MSNSDIHSQGPAPAPRSPARTIADLCACFGLLSLLATGLSFLALTDIWHGEADVSLEWNIVRAAYLLLAVFYPLAFYTVRRLLREIEGGRAL
jgi:hypothetical protein